MKEVQVLATPPLQLGEGPLWHPGLRRLVFVDIFQHFIYHGLPGGNGFTVAPVSDTVGFVVPCGPTAVVAGVRDALVWIDLVSGASRQLGSLGLPAGFRLNDGKCDAEGRLWADVMVNAGEDRTPGSGALFCVEQGEVAQRLPGMTIPNGMAWAPDGRTFYHTDTVTETIDAYAVGPDGLVSGRRAAVDLTQEQGSPDGFCIDAEGMLWVAMWGGYQVLRCDPATGRVLLRLPLPDWHVSCCAFGGEDLNTLFITSAAQGPNPGRLFAWEAPVRGTLPHEYKP